jgi:hypothetical protein
MASSTRVVRKNVMLEAPKVQLLVERLGARSESEAIRIVIDDFLFADEVLNRLRKLRRRGTLKDAYRRTRDR